MIADLRFKRTAHGYQLQWLPVDAHPSDDANWRTVRTVDEKGEPLPKKVPVVTKTYE